MWSKYMIMQSTLGEKGMREVDLPLDDYFMALAVLGRVRSQCENKVSDS